MHRFSLILILLWGGNLALAGPAETLSTYAWQMPAPAKQAASMTTPLGSNEGGIFVPAMTRHKEPLVRLVRGTETVASGYPGSRLTAPAGHHALIVGSDPNAGSVMIPVNVRKGVTLIPPVRWGGLLVEVVDAKGRPHHGGYELFRVDRQASVGLGFGAFTHQGETLRSWLLPPGVYRIVPPGASFASKKEVFSVTVPMGGLVRFRLTADSGGRFLGGTVITPNEARVKPRARSAWQTNLAIGVFGSLNHASGMVGLPDQIVGSAGTFIHGTLAYQKRSLRTSLSLELEQGFSYVGASTNDDLPLIKSKDRSRLQLLVGYLLANWVGPYVRGVASTQLFPTDAFFPSGGLLRLTRSDGSSQLEAISRGGRYRVADAFSPTVLQAGGGLALNPLSRDMLRIDLRLGLAARSNLFKGTFARIDDPNTPEVEFRQVDNSEQLGLEGTLEASLRLTGWLLYATSLEYFTEFDNFDEPVIEWRNALTFKMSKYFSINYSVVVLRQPFITNTTQLQQNVQLRASFDLL
jgi:hypothetical protein